MSVEHGVPKTSGSGTERASIRGELVSAGQLIDERYRLVRAIGQGTMGRVWHARDELLDRDVALKEIIFTSDFTEAERNDLHQRMLREARSAARLSHPAVATIFDMVEDLGRPWIVMELVRGYPLDRIIAKDGPLPPGRVAEMGRHLLAALAAAHAVGVLHRDVKPSNVLIVGQGGAVLTDFGVATIDGDPTLTETGKIIGTPAFCAPERIRGDAATPAGDLWSLGATLYSAVEGKDPYGGRGGIAATIAAIATEDPAPPRNAGPIAPTIMALLARDPASRPTAAMAMRMLADGTAPDGPPATLLDPSTEAVGFPPVPSRRPHRRRSLAAVTACLVVALGILVWGLHQSAARSRTNQASQALSGVESPSSTPSKPVTAIPHKPPKATQTPAAPSESAVSQSTPVQPPPAQQPVPPPSLSPSPSPTPAATHTALPDSGPFAISGYVSCISGNAVEGVYVAAGKGSGFSPWTGQGDGATATFTYTLPTQESYSLHVGCGGSPSSWQVATYSVTVSTAVNNFACDDVPGQSDYGTCQA
jgi:serine/threonine protein kinase